LSRALVVLLGLCAGLASLAPSGASAEIKKLLEMCPGQKLCPWFQAAVTPPKGWVEDKAIGDANHLTMLTPDKPELGADDALIYVQTSYENGPETLDQIIARNQADWRKSDPKTSITPLGTVPHGASGEPYKVFLFQNPDRPKQAFEKIAYGFAKLPNGERYFLIVVDTAASKAIVDQADDAFLDVLKQL